MIGNDDPWPLDLPALLLALRTVEVSPVMLAVPPPTRRQERPPRDRPVEISPITLRR